MNPRMADLQPYPFARMNALLGDVVAPADLAPIALSIGEPKHAPPQFVLQHLTDSVRLAADLATYPVTRGSEELRSSIAAWLQQRFATPVSSATQVLPVNGTREALFSFAQAVLSGRSGSRVMMPNPFYQIYEGAALLGGARPLFIANDPSQGYQQDFSAIDTETWRATELVYLCSPGNPTGQIMTPQQSQQLVELAVEHDFVIAADECYSEIYLDDATPPGSLLQACRALGYDDYRNCVIFHSLSKRSNLPGLRSGFVAGDAQILDAYLQYRTYHGCAMSAHNQSASALAWQDEAHVVANRALYRQKFAAVETILAPHFDVRTPQGGFYHWLPVDGDDTQFCHGLLAAQNVKVLPGQFLGRAVDGHHPGAGHVRIAWVSPLADCIAAANRLVEYRQAN